MEMNRKQLLLLNLLGLGKKGLLSDFIAHAGKNKLNFGNSAAVASLLQWYGNEIGERILKNVTQQRVKDVAEMVRSVFDLLDKMECLCFPPLDNGYPSGLLSLIDNKNHVIYPPFVFIKGPVGLLASVYATIIGSNLTNAVSDNCLAFLFSELHKSGKTVLIPLNINGSPALVRLSLSAGVVPVLLVAGGLDLYLDDFENEYLSLVLDVLDAGGTIVSVQLPGSKLSETVKIKTLLYIAGFSKNVVFSRLPSVNYESAVLESARINGSQVFVVDNGFIRADEVVQSLGNEATILKSGIRLCGLTD